MKYKYDVIWNSRIKAIQGQEENILHMYLIQELTIQTIRKQIGCSYTAIATFLKNNNVRLRTAAESRLTQDGKPKGSIRRFKDKKDLEDAIEMYNNGEVLEVIGKKYNITPRGLLMKFKKIGVKLRTLTESANLPTTYERKKRTFLNRYGVENPMQDPSINNRSNINRYKFKAVDIFGRRFSHLQGYEKQGIEYLVNELNYNVYEIESGRKVPSIRYVFEEKKKIYFPDLFIKSDNLLIEVKCEYTYSNLLKLNIAKQNASVLSGYNHMTIIFDNLGKNITDIIKVSPS
jgi:hypothetical protein